MDIFILLPFNLSSVVSVQQRGGNEVVYSFSPSFCPVALFYPKYDLATIL
jgi:hypothetical protein